jgi:hypothetical protein
LTVSFYISDFNFLFSNQKGEKNMKHLITAGLVVLIVFLFSSVATAEWSSCIGCHSGTIAAGEKVMKEKFQTIDAFVNAALASNNPLMEEIKEHKETIKAAAKDLGLKDAQAPKK